MQSTAFALLTLLLALPVLAADGVSELSQAGALSAGGFPIVIDQPGSYALTSNLIVNDPDVDAISITAEHVTIDLNGFFVSGPVTCSGAPGSIVCDPGTGRGVSSTSRNVSILNGTVTGFGAGGISLGDDATVERMRVAATGGTGIVVSMLSTVSHSRSTDNAGGGIIAGANSVVSGNAASFNNGIGLDLGIGAAYQDNVVNGNAAGSATGGVQLNDNICDSVSCGCVPVAEVCDGLDNDCDGIIDNGFQVGGVYDGDTACGSCGVDCTSILALPDGYGTCDATGPPVCELNCCSIGDPNPACSGSTDHFDLNGLTFDGCEFSLDPDAIYVSRSDPAASDVVGCGQGPGTPCASIGFGLGEALAGLRSRVLVADGLYFETVTLVPGIDLLGGYRADTWERDVAGSRATLLGNTTAGLHKKTVIAQNVTVSTTLEGFVILGQANFNVSGNSYAVWSADSTSALMITGNRILGAPAGAGLDGPSGPDGLDGTGGSPGGDFVETTNSCSVPPTPGGAGGALGCSGPSVAGGSGAEASCPVPFNAQQSGVTGDAGPGGGSGGAGGFGGNDWSTSAGCAAVDTGGTSNVGGPGSAGQPGGNGLAGVGCANPSGSVVAQEWQGAMGVGASDGTPGGGGGGGGAGGGLDNAHACPSPFVDVIGGSGGGGGSGGCGGISGSAGAPGGGSFGIFVSFSAPSALLPVIDSNLVTPGIGGAGGRGGTGGAGGIAGQGAPGGTVGGSLAFAIGPGGAGGSGGQGGHGGGGPGGCGGPSYGVYVHNYTVTPNYDTTNTFLPGGGGGASGSGGPSIGNSGTAGLPGTSANVNF